MGKEKSKLEHFIWNELWLFQTDALVHHSTYRQEDLIDVLRKMAVLVKTAESGKTTAVYRKYCGSKHLRVASMAELKSPIIQNLSRMAESVE